MQANSNSEHLRMMQQKINEAVEIMDFLNKTYGLNYSLQILQFDNNKKVVDENHYFNYDINKAAAVYFERISKILADQRRVVPELLATGNILATCIDDTNKPKDIGDWVTATGIYRVNSIKMVKDGSYVYRLDGLNPGPEYAGYRSTRFMLMHEEESVN